MTKTLMACAGLFVIAATTAVCSPPAPPPQSSAQVQAPPHAPAPALWGDMKPIVSVKELMKDMIDPASDFIFDSISTIVNKQGEINHSPKTDDDWDKIQFGAVSIAEGVYLLKVPRPFTPPGDENNSTGPDAEELSPAEILAKVQKDPVEWNSRIEALRNVGLQVMDIVKRRDAKELWDASDNLDAACEACHVSYWYPKEGEFLKKLDRKLVDLYGAKPKK